SRRPLARSETTRRPAPPPARALRGGHLAWHWFRSWLYTTPGSPSLSPSACPAARRSLTRRSPCPLSGAAGFEPRARTAPAATGFEEGDRSSRPREATRDTAHRG